MLSQFVFLLENQQNQMQLFTKKKGFFSIQISIQISIQFNSIEYQFNSIHFLFLVDWDVWTFCWNKTLTLTLTLSLDEGFFFVCSSVFGLLCWPREGLCRVWPEGGGASGWPLLFFFFFFFVYSIYTV